MIKVQVRSRPFIAKSSTKGLRRSNLGDSRSQSSTQRPQSRQSRLFFMLWAPRYTGQPRRPGRPFLQAVVSHDRQRLGVALSSIIDMVAPAPITFPRGHTYRHQACPLKSMAIAVAPIRIESSSRAVPRGLFFRSVTVSAQMMAAKSRTAIWMK